MEVIFYANKYGNFSDKAIRWYTSPLEMKLKGGWEYAPSHVEILFSDGVMFSASSRENRVRFKKHNPKGKAWIKVPIECSKDEELIVRLFCESIAGSKYDYLGVSGFVLPLGQNSSKWFCSEACTRALQQINIIELKCLVPSKTSPIDMLFALGAEYDFHFKEWRIKTIEVKV